MCQNCDDNPDAIELTPETVRLFADQLWEMAVELRKLPLDSAQEQIAALEAAEQACAVMVMHGLKNGPGFGAVAARMRARIVNSN